MLTGSSRDRRLARRGAASALLGVCVLASGCAASRPRAGLSAPPVTTRPAVDWAKLHANGKQGADNKAADALVRTTVAQATVRRVDVYAVPGAAAAKQRLANPQPSGAPLVFVVEEQRAGWLRVLLPVRPNGSSGWIRAAQVRLSQHDYRIVVALGAHTITVYRGRRVIDREPVGIGRKNTPTPGGLYYTKELLRPPNPDGLYGAYAYGLSGFSNVLSSFNGGDGVIGIHGTNDPSGLGRDVSHGCIRMSNAGITKLTRILPLGVPVEIVP
jgi:lipoprotein-anchoring transpeptidase ErfK/SrfK